MLRKTVSILLMICAGLYGTATSSRGVALALRAESPWAEERDSVSVRNGEMPLNHRIDKEKELEPREKSKGMYRLQHPEKVNLLPLILKGQTLKISVYPPDDVEEEKLWAAQKKVRRAYNDWFANAAEIIKRQNRTAEFEDILPTLEWGIPIQFVAFASDEGPEDLWVNMERTLEDVSEICKCRCTGCQLLGGKGVPMQITVVERGTYSTLLHEIGHTLGLADAYDEAYEKFASDVYGSKKRIAQTVMDKKEDTLLSEDDADGLINMMDAWNIYFLRKKYPQDWCRYVPERVRNGWDSLTRFSNDEPADRYAMGTSVENLSKLPRIQRCEH